MRIPPAGSSLKARHPEVAARFHPDSPHSAASIYPTSRQEAWVYCANPLCQTIRKGYPRSLVLSPYCQGCAESARHAETLGLTLEEWLTQRLALQAQRRRNYKLAKQREAERERLATKKELWHERLRAAGVALRPGYELPDDLWCNLPVPVLKACGCITDVSLRRAVARRASDSNCRPCNLRSHNERLGRGRSNGELEVEAFLIQLLGAGAVIASDRTVLEGNELDLWVPSRAIAVEYNGDYFHRPDHFGGRSMAYHQDKLERAKAKGVRLAFVWEADWKRHSVDVQAALRRFIDGSSEPLLAKLVTHAPDYAPPALTTHGEGFLVGLFSA